MTDKNSQETADFSLAEMLRLKRKSEWDQVQRQHERVATPAFYRMRLGRETISLGTVEFRILSLLAARPYHAFTRRHIVDAVHSERFPLSDETLDRHIASLRAKLGFFRDYIQTVPYIGYRFKE